MGAAAAAVVVVVLVLVGGAGLPLDGVTLRCAMNTPLFIYYYNLNK